VSHQVLDFQHLEPFLDGKRLAFHHTVSLFEGEALNWTEYAGGWNVAAVVEHVGLAEAAIVKQVRRMLASAPPLPPEPLGEKEADIMALFREHRLLGTKKKSPSAYEPTGVVPLAEGLKRFAETRTELKSLLPALSSRATNPLTAPIPLGVTLNACQWVTFSAFHEWAHQHQLERILQSYAR
jgi:hypothetical protein